MPPDLSVIVCTLDRAKLLGKCLESLVKQECVPWTFEAIVVDNGSRDETRELVEDLSRRHSHIRYLYESQQGLSNARNRGAKASLGKYVAYIDDDAVACPGWCGAICETFEKDPDIRSRKVGGLGGPVEPVYELGRPPWMLPEMEKLYTVLDLGNRAQLFGSSKGPLGANMAFLKEPLLANPWNEQFGRKGRFYCDETELLHRLAKQGYQMLYVPSMRVLHFVPSIRCTREWALSRFYAEGVSAFHVHRGFVAKAKFIGLTGAKLIYSIIGVTFGSRRRNLLHKCRINCQMAVFHQLLGGWGGRDSNSSTGWT